MVEYRLNRLIKNKIILGFAPFFDYSKLGYVNHEIWIECKYRDEQEKEEFLKYLISNNDVGWVAECAGRFNCAIGVMCQNTYAFTKIMKEITKKYQNVMQNYFVTVSTGIYSYSRTYLLGENAAVPVEEKSLYSSQPKRVLLDDVDLKIINIISQNAKISTKDLSKIAEISHNTARKRIVNLEQRGVIRGYHAIPRPSALGIQNFEVLIKTKPLTEENEAELREFCRKSPYIIFMIKCVGTYDLNIVIDARNINHFSKVLNQFNYRFGHLIKRMDSLSVLDVYKYKYILS